MSLYHHHQHHHHHHHHHQPPLLQKTTQQAELKQLRDDLAPAMLAPPLSPEDTAQRHIRPSLRSAFVNLVQGSVIDYIDRFGFESELLRAMYAVTDGVVGIHGNWKDPGSGMNFLAHNMVWIWCVGGWV